VTAIGVGDVPPRLPGERCDFDRNVKWPGPPAFAATVVFMSALQDLRLAEALYLPVD
jgi:hypothetical protein